MFTILVTNNEDGELMEHAAMECGLDVTGKKIWDGPVPVGSFKKIGPMVRMSTPEFFFLRMANWLPTVQAVRLGMELCGKYVTSLTRSDMDEGSYEFIKHERTSVERIEAYLRQVEHTDEGMRALEVLGMVADGSATPMATYAYMLACLPTELGGAGLPKPDVSVACHDDDGFLPRADGTYIAYDLCWRDGRVALQYVSEYDAECDLEALSGGAMHVICATDAHGIRKSVEGIASEAFGRTVEIGVEGLEPPTYENMYMTFADIVSHM